LKAALIDFRDSFTFNIAHYLEGEGVELLVIDHLEGGFDRLNSVDFIVLSPGPGLPEEKQSLAYILEHFSSSKPILGICLGMQGIVQFYGGKIYNQNEVRHGVQVKMKFISQDPIFENIPNESRVGLYHSWACELLDAKALIPLAESEEHVLIAVRHRTLKIYGLQFHPESILTEFGRQMIRNFLKIVQHEQFTHSIV
jgi:para-aminobenzoate synthetase component 2